MVPTPIKKLVDRVGARALALICAHQRACVLCVRTQSMRKHSPEHVDHDGIPNIDIQCTPTPARRRGQDQCQSILGGGKMTKAAAGGSNSMSSTALRSNRPIPTTANSLFSNLQVSGNQDLSKVDRIVSCVHHASDDVGVAVGYWQLHYVCFATGIGCVLT